MLERADHTIGVGGLINPPITGVERLSEVLDDPARLDEMGFRLRQDLWDTAVLDAVIEHGMEVRKYGPIQALVVAGLPTEPRFNLLLGAAQPSAVGHGHLADASEALRALGVDHYVPITPGLAESDAAEAWLGENGYRPRRRMARFVRDVAPPDFAEPPALEVDELTDYEAEGECFSYLIVGAFGLNLSLATLFFELPGKASWRCYAAIDEDEAAVACGAMRVEDGIALLALDATDEAARRRGCQLALLRRRIVDATAAGCRAIVAETEEPLEVDDGPSSAARNLRHAGFERVSVSVIWAP